MTDLSELEMRIITYLEEAGIESITDLLNGVSDGNGDLSEPEQLRVALERLISRGLLRVLTSEADRQVHTLPTTSASLAAISGSISKLEYDVAGRLWLDRSRTGPPYDPPFPYVRYDGHGRAVAESILKERGWRWWTARK